MSVVCPPLDDWMGAASPENRTWQASSPIGTRPAMLLCHHGQNAKIFYPRWQDGYCVSTSSIRKLVACEADRPGRPQSIVGRHGNPSRVFILGVYSAFLASIFARPASAEEGDGVARTGCDRLTAPFAATVKPNYAHVYLRPEPDSPMVGLLRHGAKVVVTSCQPDCTTSHAWASLGTDGAVRIDLLTPEPITATAPLIHLTAEGLWYGVVGKSGITIFREPRLAGRVVTRKRIHREMAFFPDFELWRSGWLERIEGGFVRARRVRLLTPSHLQGEVRPHLPMAFALRKLHTPGKLGTVVALRYDRFPVQEIDGAKVATTRGPLPRNGLRIVTLQSPPSSIPTGAKWVLVDISQQTLTAYEGETAVFATLISSGKDHKESDTHAGLYQVGHKISYSDMNGEPDDPYSVERVPYTLYFNGGEALHGAYWHDRFGWPTSHGCINLALSDARWLFEWAPPRLPESWNTIDPAVAGLSSLWVFVKEKATLHQLPQFSSADGALKTH